VEGNSLVAAVVDSQVRAVAAVVHTLVRGEVAVVDYTPELSLGNRNCGKNWL
jgi:hypothetical protein